MTQNNLAPVDEDSPPVFASWNTLYGIVLVLHALLIFSFWLFTAYFQ